MKNWKLYVAVVIPSLLATIGGIFNDMLIGSPTAVYNKNMFRFITGIVLILSIISFPWWKIPWEKYKGLAFNNYVGAHAFSWLFIWLSGLSLLYGYAAPYYFFSSFIYLGTGVSMLVLNYKGKWV